MEKIKSYNEKFFGLLGTQKKEDGVKYRLASYVLKVLHGDTVLLFNNLTKKLFALSKTEWYNLNSEQFANIFDTLLKTWTIVPENFDDLKLCDQTISLYNTLVRTKEKPNFIIFTTTKCNARCYYCFEHGQRRIDMTDKTAEDVAEFIIKNSPNKDITIKWFGGEPLYNENAIDIICNKLNENSVKFISKTTTNGYLFSDENIKKAKELWNLQSAQITLDGTEKEYNKIKNYIVNDSNAFAHVIDNIQKLINAGICVTIRLNVSDKNFDDIKNLLIYLNSKFENSKLLYICAIALYDLEHNRTKEQNDQLNKMVAEIDKMIIKYGYRNYSLKGYSHLGVGCMAELDNCYVVSPIGLLGTCEHFTEGEMMYGSIYSDKIDETTKNLFKNKVRLKACYNCPIYPTCGGLGKCPTLSSVCDGYEKQLRIRNMTECVIEEYKKFKNSIDSL